MNLHIHPISNQGALNFLKNKGCAVVQTSISFAICILDDDLITRGVIAMQADGKDCQLAHLYTDGTALVGSLLYGAAWRAAKALGYKVVGL